MPTPQHEVASGSSDKELQASGLEFDASERLRLMQSGLPLCIFLESSEVVALKPPAPLYIFVPRVSYLPTLIDKCHEHFKPYIQPSFGQPTSPFFDFGGIPIDWRLPIGVAFDILSSMKGGRAKRLTASVADTSAADAGFGELSACGCDVALPWCLTIHFHGSASSYLSGGSNKVFSSPGFVGWAGFESFFINSLKQATYIINGSAVPFQRLPKAAEMQLLTASRTGAIAEFLDCCRQLLPPMTPKHFRRIPVRLYICGPPCFELSLSFPCFLTSRFSSPAQTLDGISNPFFAASGNGGTNLSSEQPKSSSVSDAPVAATAAAPSHAGGGAAAAAHTDTATLSTLGDLVHYVLPQLFPKVTRCSAQQQAASPTATNTTPTAANSCDPVEEQLRKKLQVIEEPGYHIGRRSCCVIVHGIQPLLQTPLFWLAATAPQLDLFLHIVILVDEALMGSVELF
ncbi:autophagy protein, putative [Eimeria acervulina]|uniref:Autophagy protein 5 n=1 Tax=Eimeria acervulina TaxID=5801 RepID=U6GC62_EIMAC|nr:autophagy protein, putative [Eimeria acervulina]CDI76928.1 autophagy protein, putative [Eimeria acervulina]